MYESRAIGAAAVLLIVRVLTDDELRTLLALARDLTLSALVEVHDEGELRRALACDAQIIGVNSRDLDSFEVSLDHALRMRAMIPAGRITVAESGIHTADDVRRVRDAGFDAILVGEALMTADDPGAKLRELLRGVHV
ncbi:MAG: indole-3-glycerol-phosphate synthase [Planctomycetota bacterium]|nr:MAG: indole-3-glycerol-phosphate synthase [Planctomycetota bacterium]